MMTSEAVRRVGVAIVGLCVLGGSAFGAGFQLYTEGSAEALGQAGAISARRDMASNAWYNPASLAGWEKRTLMGGMTLANLNSTYDTGLGLDDDLEYELHVIPHLHYINPVNDRVTFTLSFGAPYGLGTTWDQDFMDALHDIQFATRPVPIGGTGDMTLWNGGEPLAFPVETIIRTFWLTPSIAWKMDEHTSFAVGISAVYSDFYMQASAMAPMYVPELKQYVDMRFRPSYEGEAIGWGYHAGLSFQPYEGWNFGLMYRSQVKLHFTGDAKDDPTVTMGGLDDGVVGDVTLPPTVVFGFSNSVIDRLVLGVDIVWTGWSTFDSLTIEHDETDMALVDSPKDYDDVVSYRVGAEYEVCEGLVGRLGYVLDKSPVDGLYRGFELPGNDRHMFCVGAGYSTDRWGVDLAYCYIVVEDADAGSEALAGQGEFEDGITHLLSASLSFSF